MMTHYSLSLHSLLLFAILSSGHMTFAAPSPLPEHPLCINTCSDKCEPMYRASSTKDRPLRQMDTSTDAIEIEEESKEEETNTHHCRDLNLRLTRIRCASSWSLFNNQHSVFSAVVHSNLQCSLKHTKLLC